MAQIQQIELTYHANYNGWSMSVDGDSEHPKMVDLTGDMCDVTVDSCDDDGNYFYSDLQSKHTSAAVLMVREEFGDDTHITVTMDDYSS